MKIEPNLWRCGVCATVLLAGTAGHADQPPATPPTTTCSLSGAVCATRCAVDVEVWRKLAGGGHVRLWRAPTRGPNLRVADDGRSLVEVQPAANLVEMDDGADTIIFRFFRPGAPPVTVRLGEMIRDVAALPRTVSHRSWARSFGYDGSHFEVNTVEGRRIVFDPATGRPIAR